MTAAGVPGLTGGDPARARVAAAVTDVVRSVLPRLEPADLAGGKHPRDLGADSVERVEIVLGCMERLGVDEPLSSFSDLPDLSALVDFLTERSAPR